MDIGELYKIYLQNPSVQTDTRKLKRGDIYFALSGPNFNGNTFASEALQKGASYAVIDDPGFDAGDQCILVANVMETLQQLAKYHRQHFSIPFIAITGSNGKTTTKELIAAVLSRRFVTYATEGNLNNHIGVPLTLLRVRKDAEMVIVEMGANHQKEIAGYCEIALPDYGLITNCGKAHIEGFGGIEGVRKGKGELYDFIRLYNGTIFINTDLDYLQDMSAGIARRITYGSADAAYIGRLQMNDVFLQVELQTQEGNLCFDTHLVGEYNFPNVMAAIAVGMHFGVPVVAIQQAIRHYNPDNSRSQWMRRGSNNVILDAYNANPSSMQAAITNFARTELPNKHLWIGGMKEMGQDEEKEHRALVDLISSYTWAGVILVGKEFRELHGSYPWFEHSAGAAEFVKSSLPVNSSILIKGSRGSKMEVMAEVL